MRIHTYLKPVVFLLCLLPLAFQIYTYMYVDLANGPEYFKHTTGDWALRFIWLVLAVTPIKIMISYTPILRYRRMLGLYAFFYVCLHLLVFGYFDVYQNSEDSWKLAFEYIAEEILERPYITVGFAAFLLMIPLAVTSTKKARSSMGKKWVRLHKLVYIIAILGVLHYYWLVKKDKTEPLVYVAILAVLFLIRIISYYRKKN